ncbi:LysR family transcriptional regulator [Burkholderia sp. Ac-20353]|uniref:LysR family transcriptional regulator n=1 Tax=Burkholderia sp. Ac-20353 TaxID=2703894 RepID=UPI00197C6556|nr:LysR family transcriptional regulator [Burkholderia sp. Ac-20353]MBN3786414.1 LysR family transcriptional regulator [Burkholderia sp. Ac-20353]
MDRFQAMQIFVHVIDVNGFAKAADRLQLARPVVTRAVKDLEARLGVRLINRTTRRLHLTEEGRLYYESAVKILSAVDESESVYRLGTARPTGTLRIDMQTSIARHLIVPKLAEFRDRYPEVDLIVGTADRIVDLIEEGIDCAIRVGALRDSTMIARQVGVFQRVTVASPNYLERAGTPETLDDLNDHKVVYYTSGKGVRPPSFDFQTEAGPTTIRMTSSIQVNDSDTYIELAKAGFGMVQPARFAVADELSRGELVEVLPQYPVPQKPISVVYPQRSNLAPKLAAFISWVADVFESCRETLDA